MREIMFRGKRTDGKGWMYGYYSFNPTTNIHWIRTPRTTYWDEDMIAPSTVGQYTGLKDKNGKRIFEGDICRNTRTGEIVSVKWHGTMAGYVWNKRRADGFLFDFGELFRACDKYEVIGNIHDNPEMLKGGEG